MTTPPNTGPRSARRTFRRILHPDMAPMVGLGFLLVTFFLLAAEFSKPTVLQLSMPVKPSPNDEAVGCKLIDAMTLVLGKHGKVWYYPGVLAAGETPEICITDFTSTGLRQVLLKQKRESGELIVLIKPSDNAKYGDIVNALDEMSITDQYQFALVDITQREEKLLRKNGL
ncbi:ExbD/TolR family protein [Hymenobacter cellulosivorans]|uniref:Biopolymer transporter ExbD n=1 Tax=Hymenobacter cellulosivorans TaxID=2932249 RepID=A0ABY4FCQ4_9BACT|nr:biopolymer transporter ExbD [Hymenobacter cellulosivorans]UOQ53808.1 biopolymer transporter ExbD [Hymenobacter cellulosivorans]